MHTKQSLCQDLQKAKIYPNDTVIMHFSMKAIGSVEGGAEGVLDALMTYFQPGLLVLPALTWANVHAEQPIFDPLQTPCCVGLLPEMFRKRMGVVRSWHPTHSVAAYGADAAAFCAGNERCDTPCARTSPWGKLLDRGAKIALVGCTLTSCTFLHGVEEWADVPGRLEEVQMFGIRTPEGTLLPTPSRPHKGSPSEQFYRIESALRAGHAMTDAVFGNAPMFVLDAVRTTSIAMTCLKENPRLFDEP